jgi:predicted ATPase
MRGETGPAEERLVASMAHSRHQGALAWELRSANSLARLYLDQAEPTKAHAALSPIYLRFTEGLSTRDLLESHSLLAGMRVARDLPAKG